MKGLLNVLDAARANKCSLFFPSSIGAFGPTTPHDGTPQDTIQRPESMYGVTKVAGELLCDYYFKRFGVDTRGVRFPGIISNGTLPGGGTTDYAVEIFYSAIKAKKYTCFLKEGTSLDMMYMPDAIKAAIGVMEADPEQAEAPEFVQRHRDAFHSRDARRGDPEAHHATSRWITGSIPCVSGSPIRGRTTWTTAPRGRNGAGSRTTISPR